MIACSALRCLPSGARVLCRVKITSSHYIGDTHDLGLVKFVISVHLFRDIWGIGSPSKLEEHETMPTNHISNIALGASAGRGVIASSVSSNNERKLLALNFLPKCTRFAVGAGVNLQLSIMLVKGVQQPRE